MAERLKQAGETGGGTSTAPVPTALEQLVESTLLPESVSGIGDADSSARAANRQGKMNAEHGVPPIPKPQSQMFQYDSHSSSCFLKHKQCIMGDVVRSNT